MKKTKLLKRWMAGLLTAVILLGSLTVIPVNASAPQKKRTAYEGYGKVEVEFRNKVQWKSPKVTVKDSSGKACKVKIREKDDDEIEFRILNYKQGAKYTYKITGIREKGTSSYGTVTGTVTIPKTKVSEAKAINIARNDAVKRYKVNKSDIKNIDLGYEKYAGKKVFEVEFKAKKSGRVYEYEYKIDMNSGKILKREQDS